MSCPSCHGLMVEDHFYDFAGTAGFMWMRGWRCMNCGHGVKQSHNDTINRRVCSDGDHSDHR